MDMPKQRSKLPAVVAMLVAGLTMAYGDTNHLCHLQSTIVEIPLLVGVVLACYLWTARAKTSGQAWRRMGLAFLLAIAIEMVYLTWLHSDFFPRVLLSPAAKQCQGELDKLRQTDRGQQAPGGEAPTAIPQK
jgi:cytochrome bd-type quinol oxidase subunit 2